MRKTWQSLPSEDQCEHRWEEGRAEYDDSCRGPLRREGVVESEAESSECQNYTHREVPLGNSQTTLRTEQEGAAHSHQRGDEKQHSGESSHSFSPTSSGARSSFGPLQLYYIMLMLFMQVMYLQPLVHHDACGNTHIH